MPTSRSTKALLVSLPTALWMTHGDASLGRSLALAAGAALATVAWLKLAAPRAASPAPAVAAPLPFACSEQRRCADRPIARTPTGRAARDVRCPATRAAARRPTRR